MSQQPITHRSHDYRYLIQRWKALAKRAGLTMRSFVKISDWPVYQIKSPAHMFSRTTPAIYLSTGVHGDEPAPPWGLLDWAEAHAGSFTAAPLIIYPCLNPHGLVNNTRRDELGVDINRSFHREDHPLVTAWRETMRDRQVAAAFHLHEDFDAQGLYLYELNQHRELLGHHILADCASIIPPDQRAKIEGWPADQDDRAPASASEFAGLPEALALHQLGSPYTFTFESPSEFALPERIAVHKRFVESALHHVCGI